MNPGRPSAPTKHEGGPKKRKKTTDVAQPPSAGALITPEGGVLRVHVLVPSS